MSSSAYREKIMPGLANVVTSLRTKNLHKSSLISHPRTPFWVTVYMTSVNGTLQNKCASQLWDIIIFSALCDRNSYISIIMLPQFLYLLKYSRHHDGMVYMYIPMTVSHSKQPPERYDGNKLLSFTMPYYAHVVQKFLKMICGTI